MNFKNSILIISGEPNSVFLEIFFKTLKRTKIKKPLILIASHKHCISRIWPRNIVISLF